LLKALKSHRRSSSQRFSIAHELGHYCLEGHPDALLSNGRHYSRAGFVSSDPFEQEADHFSHYFLRHYKRGGRREAEEEVARVINAIIDGEIDLPSGYDVVWFESFLKLDDPNAND